jgi:hypothetical protein
LAEAGNLIDEDRWRAARVRSNKRAWLKERLPAPGGHYLDKNFAQRNDRFHLFIVGAGRQGQRPSDFR